MTILEALKSVTTSIKAWAEEKFAKQDSLNDISQQIGLLEVGKVDKVDGKGLSTNDFTDDYKNKIDNLEDLGAGDMLKSIYDKNGNGIVDNAEKLNGHDASYYAVAAWVTEQINAAVEQKTKVQIVTWEADD